MKPSRTLLLLPFDLAAVWISAAWAPELRQLFDPAGPVGEAMAAARPMLDPLLIALLWCGVFAWLGLYRPVHRISGVAVVVDVVRAAGVSLIVVVAATFFLVREQFLPARSLPLMQAGLAVPLVSLFRLTGLGLLAALVRAGWGRSRVAVIGTGAVGAAASEQLRRERQMGSELVGFVRGVAREPDAPAAEQPILGSVDELPALLRAHRLERIVLADPAIDHPTQRAIALACERLGVELDRVADFASAGRLQVVPGTLGDMPLLRVSRVVPNRFVLAVKRGVDLAVALGLLVLLSPLLALAGAALALERQGPAVITQSRVGRGGTLFRMFKLRSMRDGARRETEAWDGHLWKDPNDPRVTPVGRWLRRYSLDELPQLVNVVRGEMSLVGPRPLLASDLGPDGQSARYPVWSEIRARMRPGITGLWQVRGRKELSFEEMMRLDVFYCENWTLMLDLAILLETVPAVLKGRGAY